MSCTRFIKITHLANKQSCDHFVAIGYNERSVFRWFKILRETGDFKRKAGSGRPVKIATKGNIEDHKKIQ